MTKIKTQNEAYNWVLIKILLFYFRTGFISFGGVRISRVNSNFVITISKAWKVLSWSAILVTIVFIASCSAFSFENANEAKELNSTINSLNKTNLDSKPEPLIPTKISNYVFIAQHLVNVYLILSTLVVFQLKGPTFVSYLLKYPLKKSSFWKLLLCSFLIFVALYSVMSIFSAFYQNNLIQIVRTALTFVFLAPGHLGVVVIWSVAMVSSDYLFLLKSRIQDLNSETKPKRNTKQWTVTPSTDKPCFNLTNNFKSNFKNNSEILKKINSLQLALISFRKDLQEVNSCLRYVLVSHIVFHVIIITVCIKYWSGTYFGPFSGQFNAVFLASGIIESFKLISTFCLSGSIQSEAEDIQSVVFDCLAIIGKESSDFVKSEKFCFSVAGIALNKSSLLSVSFEKSNV